MKKIIRLLTLALLTVPVTTFAQSEGNQNTSEPAGKVVASKPDSLLDWETPHDPTCPRCCWKHRWATFSWLSTTILPSIGIIS